MFNNKHSKPLSRIDTLIGEGTSIDGDVSFSGGMRIDGQVVGNVIAVQDKPATLVLSERARITGEVRVTHLVVNGTISGPVTASEYLELQGKAKVAGDVHYKTLEIHLGAIVEGRLIHSDIAVAQEKVVALKVNAGE
jgi:cytoskeletal protein CcmA (bactofilin family)